ncbi:hypothetical protein V8F06_011948 [Rhypophila decipiens]
MTSSVNEGVGVGAGVEVAMADGAAASVGAAPGLVPSEAGAEVQSLPLSLPQSVPQSPAPPAISPLTEPTDPGNREPSINPINLDGDANPVPVPATLAPATAQQYLDTFSQFKAEPQISDGTIPQHLQYPTDMMDLDPISAQSAMGGLYGQPDPSPILLRLAQLAAASASNQRNNMGVTPKTVHPSQVSLPQMFYDTSANGLQQATENGNTSNTAEDRLESFARIEFADSVFQVTTHAVIIGRDTAAVRQSKRDQRRETMWQDKVFRAQLRGEPVPSPPKRDRSRFSKSYVSNEGGMLGPEPDSDQDDENPTPRPTKRRKGNDGSVSELPQRQTEPTAEDLVFSRQYVSHTPGAAAVNLDALRPSPNYVPFIGIHSPGPNIAEKTKAISRQHLKIQFNKESSVWEAIPLHSNGFFCDDKIQKLDSVVLKSGSRLQIKDVSFTFIINNVPLGSTGAELYQDDEPVAPPGRRYSEGGKEMSFDFESSHDVDRRSSSPEEDEQAAQVADESQSELSDVEMEDLEQEDENEDGVMETIENDGDENTQHQRLSQDQSPAQAGTEPGGTPGPGQPPKKRGPGRPPKNGIMSKREERAQKKAAIELAKKNAPPPPPGEPPIKRKVGRPRKHPLPEDGGERPEKRKYKPRKSKNGEEGEGSEAEKAVKEKRREKPKTPPLELRREDYTEEELLKPTSKNYGVLIDEVLTAAPDGLTLKQIYKRIQQKYPYFYFNVDTKGWESSVRHNLIGNNAFKKNDQTHLWSRVPGIDIDAGKKRKATSPENSSNLHGYGHQQYQPSMTPHAAAYPADNNTAHQTYQPRPAQQPGHANHGQLGSGPSAQQPQQFARPPAQVGVPAQQSLPRPAYSSQTPGQQPPVGVAGTSSAGPSRPLPATGAQNAAYSSPYVSGPASQMAQAGATPHSMARQLSQSSNGVSQANSLPPVANPNATPVAHSGTGTPQPVVPGGSTAPVGPPVSAELIKLVDSFKALVAEQLKERSKAPLLLAMSAIFRALGLSSNSIVPEEQALEDIIVNVFNNSKKNRTDASIHPDLHGRIMGLKKTMVEVLSPKLGQIRAECLFLSAVGRSLGFIERSIVPDSQNYVAAENVLKTPLDNVVAAHQAWKVTQAPRPPAPSPGQPSQTAAQGPTQAQGRPAVAQSQTPQAPIQAQRAQVTPQRHASQAPMAPTQAPLPAQGVSAAQRQLSQVPTTGPMQVQGPPAVSQPQASQAPLQGTVQSPAQGQRAQVTAQSQPSQAPMAPMQVPMPTQGLPAMSQAQASQATNQAPAQISVQGQRAQVASPAPTHAPVQTSVQAQQAQQAQQARQAQQVQTMAQGQASRAPVTAMQVPVQAATQVQRPQAVPQGQASQAPVAPMHASVQARPPHAAPQARPSQAPMAPIQTPPQAQGPHAAPQARVQAAASSAVGYAQPSAQSPVLARAHVAAQPVSAQATVTSQVPVATQAPVTTPAPVAAQVPVTTTTQALAQGPVAAPAPTPNNHISLASQSPVQAAVAPVPRPSGPAMLPPKPPLAETPRLTTPPRPSITSTTAPVAVAPVAPMTVPAVASAVNQAPVLAPAATSAPVTTPAPMKTEAPAVAASATIPVTKASQPKVQFHALPPKPPPPHNTMLPPSPAPASTSTATMPSTPPRPNGLISAPAPFLPPPPVAPAPTRPAQETTK